MLSTSTHANATDFIEEAESWLLQQEDRYNLILSLAYARAASSVVDESQRDFFGVVRGAAGVVGCAIRTPPHKVLLTSMPLEAAPALADALSSANDHIPAVLGPEPVAAALAAEWVVRRGGSWKLGLEQRVYRLDEVIRPVGAEGELRVATPPDLDLAIEWAEGFGRDAGSDFRPKTPLVKRWVEEGVLHFWTVSGAAVSMAVAHGRTPRGVRVGYVYTPTDLRGRGYASACVAEVSQCMLDSGLDFCVLYTDLSNPTSNAIYQRIGYRAVADERDCHLSESGPS